MRARLLSVIEKTELWNRLNANKFATEQTSLDIVHSKSDVTVLFVYSLTDVTASPWHATAATRKKFQLRYHDNPSQKNKRTNKNRSGPSCYVIILSRSQHCFGPTCFHFSTKPHYSFSLCIRSIRSQMDPTSRFNSSLPFVLSYSWSFHFSGEPVALVVALWCFFVKQHDRHSCSL